MITLIILHAVHVIVLYRLKDSMERKETEWWDGRRQSGGIRDVGGEGEWLGQQLPSPH